MGRRDRGSVCGGKAGGSAWHAAAQGRGSDRWRRGDPGRKSSTKAGGEEVGGGGSGGGAVPPATCSSSALGAVAGSGLLGWRLGGVSILCRCVSCVGSLCGVYLLGCIAKFPQRCELVMLITHNDLLNYIKIKEWTQIPRKSHRGREQFFDNAHPNPSSSFQHLLLLCFFALCKSRR